MDWVIEPKIDVVKGEGAFSQVVELREGEKLIGRARWATSGELSEGVAQVTEIWVLPEARRRGHGRRLMEALTPQALAYFKARKSVLRRVIALIDQKAHVVARSFLMKFTFHHVGTVKEVLKDGDLLVYMRTFD